jgi:hypothetical protein
MFHVEHFSVSLIDCYVRLGKKKHRADVLNRLAVLSVKEENEVILDRLMARVWYNYDTILALRDAERRLLFEQLWTIYTHLYSFKMNLILFVAEFANIT